MVSRHLLILAALLGCGADPVESPPEGGVQVLFVGNSLTYFNDLPNTVAAIATAGGDTIRVETHAGPGLALIDHLTGSTQAAQAIQRGGWDFVILQQGPTPAGICRDSLILWTGMFDQLTRPKGAELAVMMTWPTNAQRSAFDVVRESFLQAAASVGGIFLPAGEAWRSAWREDPSLELYGPDGFHPSPMGTFLAALEIYERLTGRDARDLPPVAFTGPSPLNLPVATIRLLQRAAHDANTQFPARPAPAPPATRTVTAATC